MAKKKSRRASTKRSRKTIASSRRATSVISSGPSVSDMRAANTSFLKFFGMLAVVIIFIALLYSVMPGLFSGLLGPSEVDFGYTDANEVKYSFNTVVPFGTKVTDSQTDEGGNILPATLENADFKMDFEARSESFEMGIDNFEKLDEIKNFENVFKIDSTVTNEKRFVYGNRLYEDDEVCQGIGIALTEVAFSAPCGETTLYLGDKPSDGIIFVACTAKSPEGVLMCDDVVRELRVEIVE